MKPGVRIRDYILERRVGEGGMGEVWLARHAHLGKAVAIKAMAEGLAADPKFRERFLAEARAMAGLQHPHIVGATDFFEEAGRLLLVMPFVEGHSLADRLDRTGGSLPVFEALLVSRDILGALDHAHRKGVIHRDVKPSNILLDGEGHAFLTDFGIALMVGDIRRTRTGVSVGTPHYMSPEQIERPKQVDHRTDVYSFGCVLFEMLCGRPPFVGDGEDEGSDFRVRHGHVMTPPPAPRAINPCLEPWLEAVVLRSLEKTPDGRFQGCGEFAKALSDRSLPAPTRPGVGPERNESEAQAKSGTGQSNHVDRGKVPFGAASRVLPSLPGFEATPVLLIAALLLAVAEAIAFFGYPGWNSHHSGNYLEYLLGVLDFEREKPGLGTARFLGILSLLLQYGSIAALLGDCATWADALWKGLAGTHLAVGQAAVKPMNPATVRVICWIPGLHLFGQMGSFAAFAGHLRRLVPDLPGQPSPPSAPLVLGALLLGFMPPLSCLTLLMPLGPFLIWGAFRDLHGRMRAVDSSLRGHFIPSRA